MIDPAACHPERPKYRRDLCSSCYDRARYWQNAERRREQKRAERARNPEQVRARDREQRRKELAGGLTEFPRYLRRRYGLTPEAYYALLRAQGGTCKSCGEHMAAPVIDHCHRTGLVRALLCQGCNVCVGSIEAPRFDACLRYVRRWEQRTC